MPIRFMGELPDALLDAFHGAGWAHVTPITYVVGPDGKIVRDIPQKMAFGGLRLPNGNTILACGDAHLISEVDPAGKVVWQITENELPGNPLRFIGGMRMAANGNLIVANWGGHGRIGQQPQVFEVTHDQQKKVVGVIHDDVHFKTISGMFVLDEPAKAER